MSKHATKRKCIFTNKEANDKLVVGKDDHNWARGVPCNRDYKELRKGEVLSEDEMDLIALFYLIESHQLRLDNLRLEMEKIQRKLLVKMPFLEKEKNNKNKEIERAFVEKEIIDEGRDAIEEVLNKKLKLWD
jgi:predicted metal-dependent phosphoesterase TrpH